MVDLEIWSPIINVGVRYKNHIQFGMPLSGNIDGNLKTTEKSAKISMPNPSEQKQLANLESSLQVYASNYKQYVKTMEFNGDLPMVKNTKNKVLKLMWFLDYKPFSINTLFNIFKQQNCINEPFTDVKICFETSNVNNTEKQNIWTPKSFSAFIQPDRSHSKQIDLKITAISQNDQESDYRDYESDQTENRRLKIESKSGPTQAALSLLYMTNLEDNGSKLKAIFSKLSPNKKPTMVKNLIMIT